jgi:hypothetical protein
MALLFSHLSLGITLALHLVLISVAGVFAVPHLQRARVAEFFPLALVVGGTVRIDLLSAELGALLGRGPTGGSWFLLSSDDRGGLGYSSSPVHRLGLDTRILVTAALLGSGWERDGTCLDLNLDGEDDDQKGKRHQGRINI